MSNIWRISMPMLKRNITPYSAAMGQPGGDEAEPRNLIPLRNLLVVLFLVFSTGGATAQSADDDIVEREARLTRIQGTVYVHVQSLPEGEYIEAEQGVSLGMGDIVRTGTDGQAEIALDGTSIIELESNSDLILNSLDLHETEFNLGIGSLFAKLKRLVAGQRMEFHTPTAVAAVRGTELGISRESENEPTRVGVFDEGHVIVRAPNLAGEIHLRPGLETMVNTGDTPAPARPLQTFLDHRSDMAFANKRSRIVQKAWVPRTPSKRLELRRALAQKPPVIRMNNVREDISSRKYGSLKARQEEIRARGLEFWKRKAKSKIKNGKPESKIKADPPRRPRRRRAEEQTKKPKRKKARGAGSSKR